MTTCKKTFSVLMALVLALSLLVAAPLTAFAADGDGLLTAGEIALNQKTEGDFDYVKIPDGGSVQLVAYHGSDKEVTIPSSLGGQHVSVIGENGQTVQTYTVTGSTCALDVQVRLLRRDEDDEDLLVRMPDHSRHPVLLGSRQVAASLIPDPQSWIVFIPFDTCAFRLSGSLLSQAYDLSGAAAPDVGDADYFTDCFEVVREMVEDGVVIAGATVREGGMLTALRHMCQDCGAGVNIADIMKTYGEGREERVLFAEVPGVLLQIRDIDYDYFDAEMLLQDVAYFPVGHPIPGGGLRVDNFSRTGIQSILDSLLLNQGSEGED